MNKRAKKNGTIELKTFSDPDAENSTETTKAQKADKDFLSKKWYLEFKKKIIIDNETKLTF